MTTSTESSWRRVRVGDVALALPADLVPAGGEQALEGPVVVLTGRGLRVTLDASPFADQLTGYVDRPGYRRWEEQVGGDSRDLVSFRDDDGTTVVATRLPVPVTVVVHVAPDGDADVEDALRILRSITPRQGEDHG